MGRKVILVILLGGLIAILGCSGEDQSAKISEIEEQNKATVRRLHSEMSKGNQAIFDELLTHNYIRHCQAMAPEFQELRGTEVFKAFIADFLTAVPDVKDSILVMIAENDKVAYVTNMTGTQTGTMGGLPPSGKSFAVTNIIIHRFENGKIAESWVSWDNVAMLTQLGLFPPSPPPAQP